MPAKHKLRVPLHRRERVAVAAFLPVAEPLASLFLAGDEPPDLIALNVAHGNPVNDSLHEWLALRTDPHEQGNDRVPVDACQALRAADAVAFQEQAKGKNRVLGVDTAPVNLDSLRVRECATAG